MKKPNKNNRNLILLIFLIIFAVAVTVTVITVCAGLYKNDKLESNDFVSISVSLVAFLGTVTLGIISFWQTKSANAISETLSRENMRCNITLLGDVKLTQCNLTLPRVLEFAKTNETEGLVCSEYDKQTLFNHNGDDYLCLELCFTTQQAAIEGLKIKEIYFCKTFENDSAHKDYFIKFNIFNSENKVAFSYNPSRGCYVLLLCLNCDNEKLREINKNEYFQIDFLMEAESNYKVKQSLEYSLNFTKISKLNDLLNKKINKIELKLERVTVHKGEIKYE